MKKLLSFLIFFLFLFISSFNLALSQEKLREEVTVIAVEIPVRVLHKNQVVKNLTRKDFEIYENGVKQEITGFEVISRKISIPQEERKTHQKKRLFLLIFNVFDYNEAVGEAIDYFFENFFHQGDLLIILTEDKLLNIEKGKNLSEVILRLKRTLKKCKRISAHNVFKAYKDLRYEADRLLMVLRGDSFAVPESIAIGKFFDNYLRIWRNYKIQYLIPDIKLYQSISKRIKHLEGEKWAICFQQRDMFPRLRNEGPLKKELRDIFDDPREELMTRSVQVKLWDLERSLDVSQNFPTEFLKNLFMEANISFHLILMKSHRNLISQDFEMREVTQDYEDCFKQISTSTGGYTAFSNKVSEVLHEASETEDYYYLLVYSPKEDQSAKKRDIEVKVTKSGTDIIYLKHVPEKEAPPITITDFKAGRKSIKFSLINYQRAKIKEKLSGTAAVKITLFDEDSKKILDEAKTLALFKKETHISLNFNWLKSGSYFLIIQAMDKISGETDVFSNEVEF